MIVRGTVAVRLQGRKRERVPTTMVEGLARWVVTGSFHHHVETELVSENEARRRVVAELVSGGEWAEPAGGEAGGAEAAVVVRAREDGLSGGQGARDGLVLTVRITARGRHPRGMPGATLEVVAIPVPPGLAGADGAELQKRARRMVADRNSCEARLARAQERVEQVLEQVLAATRRALPVESAQIAVERGVAREWPEQALAGLPAVAAAWMGAMGAAGADAAWLGGVAPSSADGGGLLDASGADGGGAFDGGARGTDGAHGAHGTSPGADLGGGDLGPGHGL